MGPAPGRIPYRSEKTKCIGATDLEKGEFRCTYIVQDYEATLPFYRDRLELPVVEGWDRRPEDRGALFSAAS